MALKPCPDCGNQVSTHAQACPQCGRPNILHEPSRNLEDEYDLPAKAAVPAIRPEFLRGLGVILFIGGLIGALYYFAYFDTTVASPTVELFGESIGGGRVHNIGLMQERQLGLGVSVAAALVGLVALMYAQKGTSG